jgi:capsular exopolysaccharide synthesis family protein
MGKVMNKYEIVHSEVRDPAPYIRQEGGGTAREIDTIGALKRRRFMILFLIGTAMTATFLVGRLMTPLYEAEADIMFNPRELSWMGDTTQPGALPPSEESARKNEIAIVQSRVLAEAVVDRLELHRIAEFNPSLRPSLSKRLNALVADWAGPALSLLPFEAGASEFWRVEALHRNTRDEIVNGFQRRLEATSSDASRVISIRFRSEDAQRATLIANAVADHFIAQKRDQEVSAAEALGRSLTQEIADLNRDIRDAERQLEETRIALGLHSDSNIKALADRMTELNRQLIGATAERLRAEAQFAEAQSVRSGTGSESAAQVLDSPLIQRLQEAAAVASAQVGQLSIRYRDNHPALIAARTELRDLRSRIGDEVQKIQNSRLNAVAIAKTNEEGLRHQVNLLNEQMAKANASEVDVRVMEREVEAKRTLLPQLAARLNNANAQIDYLKLHGPDTQVISRAVVPPSTSFPPTLAMLATAFVLSAGGGGVLALLLERADNTVQSLSQIRRMTPVRVVGALPIADRRRWRRRPPAEHVVDETDSMFIEHLRSLALRTGLGEPTTKVLLFTSSVSEEGKSSAASSLARMLALSGRKTVIIDADLRAPTVHRIFGMNRGPGLTECVMGGHSLSEVMRTDTASGAEIITAGQNVASPSDVLQSPRLQELVSDLAVMYDAVIIDSPPVLAACDAHILARLADRTLMIVRWRSTRISTFVSAMQRLSDDRIPVDGVILSQVDGRKYRLHDYGDSAMFSAGFRKYYTRT